MRNSLSEDSDLRPVRAVIAQEGHRAQHVLLEHLVREQLMSLLLPVFWDGI